MITKFIFLMLLGLSLAGLYKDKFLLDPIKQQKAKQFSPQFSFLISAERKDKLSNNIQFVLDNFYSIWFLQNMVDEENKPQNLDELENYTKHLVAYKVKRSDPYLLACYKSFFDLKSGEICRTSLSTGAELLPSDWRLAAVLGFIEFKFYGDSLTASKYIDIAASNVKAPEFYKDLAQKLALDIQFDQNQFTDTMEKVLHGTVEKPDNDTNH